MCFIRCKQKKEKVGSDKATMVIKHEMTERVSEHKEALEMLK